MQSISGISVYVRTRLFASYFMNINKSLRESLTGSSLKLLEGAVLIGQEQNHTAPDDRESGHNLPLSLHAIGSPQEEAHNKAGKNGI